MITDWEKAIEFVLRMEGGETAENDPHDPGGLTRYGISQKAYPNLDIKNLTLDAAKQLYQRDYWTPCHCDDLPTALAIATFDCAVNQGQGKARRLLQIALDVEVDGNIGPKTIAAAAGASRYRIKRLLALRLAEYARLISENKKLLVYAMNWSFRVISLAELILGGKLDV